MFHVEHAPVQKTAPLARPAFDELVTGGIKRLHREDFRQRMNRLEDSATQWQAVADYFEALGDRMDRMPEATAGWFSNRA